MTELLPTEAYSPVFFPQKLWYEPYCFTFPQGRVFNRSLLGGGHERMGNEKRLSDPSRPRG
jgi:hypothetical protein